LKSKHGYEIKKNVSQILERETKLNNNLLYPALLCLEKAGAVENLKLAKEVAESVRYPVLSAFFNDKYSYGIEKLTDTNRSWFNSWNTGLQLSIPLDTLLPVSKTSYNMDETEQNIKKILLAEQQLNDGITLQIRSLFMQIDQAKESIESQYETLNQAKLSMEIAASRYQAGSSSLLDVTDAEVNYTQSQVSYLQATYDYFSSVIQLKRLIGM
jgi:outer membrane protein